MHPNLTRRALLNRPLDSLLAALQDPSTPDPRVFPKLFPNPTGQNGWEDFVLAGDALLGVAIFDQAQEATATLTLKRNALSHPAVRRALALIRTGLTKPITSPRTTIALSTTFPDLAIFRRLARLLAIEQQVLFADGRPGGALDAFRVGVRLAEVPKGEILIGGLVGVASLAIALARCMRHMECVPQRECDALATFLRQYLAADDRVMLGLAGERRALDSILADLEKSGDVPQGFLGSEADPGVDMSPEELYALRRLRRDLDNIKENPGRRTELIRDTRTVVDQYFQSQFVHLAAPWDERPVPTPDDSMAGRLAAVLLPGSQAVERFAESRAQVTLLLGHTLIRRYRWELDRLPESIDDLKAGEPLTDPFSRKPLIYRKLTNATYELESVGPVERDEHGAPIPGQRRAVHLPYRRKG